MLMSRECLCVCVQVIDNNRIAIMLNNFERERERIHTQAKEKTAQKSRWSIEAMQSVEHCRTTHCNCFYFWFRFRLACVCVCHWFVEYVEILRWHSLKWFVYRSMEHSWLQLALPNPNRSPVVIVFVNPFTGDIKTQLFHNHSNFNWKYRFENGRVVVALFEVVFVVEKEIPIMALTLSVIRFSLYLHVIL